MSDPRALTLILTHCVGAHKEQWEITLAKLFALTQSAGQQKLSIREAWSIDNPNHGESGAIISELGA